MTAEWIAPLDSEPVHPVDPAKAVRVQLVNQYLDYLHTRDEAQEHMDRVAEVLVLVLGAGGSCEVEAGNGVAVSKPRRTFKPRLAYEALTPEELTAISAWEPNSTLARERLTPEQYERCSVLGRPFLRVLKP